MIHLSLSPMVLSISNTKAVVPYSS